MMQRIRISRCEHGGLTFEHHAEPQDGHPDWEPHDAATAIVAPQVLGVHDRGLIVELAHASMISHLEIRGADPATDVCPVWHQRTIELPELPPWLRPSIHRDVMRLAGEYGVRTRHVGLVLAWRHLPHECPDVAVGSC